MKWLVLVALAACGRMGFEPGEGGEASPDAAMGREPGGGCVLGPWTKPQAIAAVNTISNEVAPALSADGLTLIFETDRNVSRDLYISTRTSTGYPFGIATPLPGFSSPIAQERDPTLSMDGLTLYFTSTLPGVQILFRATRASTTKPFNTSAAEPELASLWLAGPAVSSDGQELFYSDFTESQISRARLVPGSGFVPDTTLAALGGGYASAGPSLSGDGLTIYYRHKTDVLAAYDIYVADRPSITAPFNAPTPLTELDDAHADDGDPEISKDGKTIIFASSRPGGTGSMDLYMATRDCM